MKKLLVRFLAKTFYEKVLNTELSQLPSPEIYEDDMQMLFFPMEMQGEGSRVALVKMKGYESSGNGSIVYFGSEDCVIEENRVEKAGDKIFKFKQSIGGYGFIVLAYDTKENMFGIHFQK